MTLSLLTWAPLLGALLIMCLPARAVRAIQAVAVAVTGFSMLQAVHVFAHYSAVRNGWAFEEKVAWLEQLGISYHLGVDGLSAPMVLLSGLICFTAAMISLQISFRQREYFALALVAMSGVYGVFVSLDLFFFVVFYELASIPMFFLVGIWGSDKIGEGRAIHREKAAMKLLLYLQLGGGLVLLGILALYQSSGLHTFDLPALLGAHLGFRAQVLIFLLLFIGFGIEAGLVPFHTWLPEGHSSAPTALSMLLAGVLLKMGGYGILRLGVQLLPEGAQAWSGPIAVLAVINVLYGGLCALRQTDIKVMIAYSSVSHMGMVFWGLACVNAVTAEGRLFGLSGAVFQMFSHGVITALLFALAGTVYHITHNRNLRAYGGLAVQMPFLATNYVLAAMASLGLPGMTGFAAELMVFLGAWQTNWQLVCLTVPGLVITTTYLLRSVQFVFYGPLNPEYLHARDANPAEIVPVVVLAFTTLLFGVIPALLMNPMLPTLQQIVGRLP